MDQSRVNHDHADTTKECPKCGSEMINNKQLGSYTELMLRTKDQYLGDRVLTFYCANCGFIELYKKMKEQIDRRLGAFMAGQLLSHIESLGFLN